MKKTNPFSANQFGKEKTEENSFYFQAAHYKWMIIGLGIIILGFVLMLGADANTVDGVYNPHKWNQDIFSFRRIRVAPFLVILGFAIEVYAILKRNK